MTNISEVPSRADRSRREKELPAAFVNPLRAFAYLCIPPANLSKRTGGEICVTRAFSLVRSSKNPENGAPGLLEGTEDF